MRKLSQLELLSEGFWSAFTKPARLAAGAARAGIRSAAKTLDYVVPELTKPIHDLESAGRDILGIEKEPKDATFQQRSKGLKQFAKDNLEEHGYELDPKSKFVKRGNNYVVAAYKIIRYDEKGNPILSNKPTSFILDKHGNIIKNLRNG